MSSSGSWSNELLNEGQALLESDSESDNNLGMWVLIPLSMIAIFLISVRNYEPCKEADDSFDTPP